MTTALQNVLGDSRGSPEAWQDGSDTEEDEAGSSTAPQQTQRKILYKRFITSLMTGSAEISLRPHSTSTKDVPRSGADMQASVSPPRCASPGMAACAAPTHPPAIASAGRMKRSPLREATTVAASSSTPVLDGTETDTEEEDCSAPAPPTSRSRSLTRSKSFFHSASLSQSSRTPTRLSLEPGAVEDGKPALRGKLQGHCILQANSTADDLQAVISRRKKRAALPKPSINPRTIKMVADQAKRDRRQKVLVVHGRLQVMQEAAKKGEPIPTRIRPEIVLEHSPTLRAAIQVLRHQVMAGTLKPLELNAEHVRAVLATIAEDTASGSSRKRSREADDEGSDDDARVVRLRLSEQDDDSSVNAPTAVPPPLRSAMIDKPVVDATKNGVYKPKVKAKALQFAAIARSMSGTIMEPTLAANMEQPPDRVDMAAVRRAEEGLDFELITHIVTLIET